MRVVVQRVRHASVTIVLQQVAAIEQGLLILVGIEEHDSTEDADWLAAKIVAMRLFSDAEGKMNLDVQQINGEALVVSQFTLHASTKKGNRPSFIKAARPEQAIPLYTYFVKQLSERLGKPVPTGQFGADMQVALVNDGPVTVLIDSKIRE
jgi:D-tyrosyl-tRNA(Tyr) deacylase